MLDIEDHARTVVERAPDVFLTVDHRGVVHFVNPAVEDVFGYAPDAVYGDQFTDLIRDASTALQGRAFGEYARTATERFSWDYVELTGQHADGRDVPISVSFTEFERDGDTYFTAIVRERERPDATTELRAAVLDQLGDGVYALDADGRFVLANRAYAEIVGVPVQALLGRPAEAVVSAESVEAAATIQADLESGETETLRATIDTGDGSPTPFEASISLFPLGDDEYGRIGVVRDVSDNRRREARLAALNETAQSLAAAETTEAVCSVALETATETLDLAYARIERFDEGEGELIPVATADPTGVGSDESDASLDENAAWEVYTENEPRVYEDVTTAALPTHDETLDRVLALPLESFGVLLVGWGDANEVDETSRQLIRILASNTAAALERVEREEKLRERSAELADKTEVLQRVERINAVIRDITRKLTAADDRSEILQSVCTALAGTEHFRHVWIGERNTVEGRITAAEFAGVDRGYLDAITDESGCVVHGPTDAVVETGEAHVENRLSRDSPFDPWQTEALQRGYRSCLAVPVKYRESLFGVLNVAANRTGVFRDLEVEVLTELGEMIGYALNAIERKKAVVSGGAIELEFELQGPEVAALEFTSETGARFEFDTIVEQSDGTLSVYFTVYDVTPETVRKHAAQTTAIRDLSFVADRDDGLFFRATLTAESFLNRLLDHGAQPTSLEASGDKGSLTVELPDEGDVPSFIDMFLSTMDGAELVARRELDRPIRTESEFQAAFRERLTERQEEVLKTAYFAGFFDWPRESSGRDVAEMLGVSQPTVNRHVREGERKLFELLFEDL